MTPDSPGTSGYARGQNLTLVGGSFTQAAQVNVRSTRLVATPTVAAQGSGYPDGGHDFEIEGGEGTPARVQTSISGGIVTITGLSFPGSYTTNPSSPAATRRLDGSAGSGLTVTGLAFGVDTLAVSATVPGAYTSLPTGTIATTGTGAGATLTATFELGTVTGSGGSGFTTPPGVGISGGGGAAIELIGDRPTFNGPLIGDLASCFTGNSKDYKGSLQSTRLRQLAGAGPRRDLDGRLRESVSVRDFGAIGDGWERSIREDPRWPTSNVLADFVTVLNAGLPDHSLDFVTTGDAFRLMDTNDTLDWLAFELALRELASRGGGVLLVPDGHYVTNRHVNLLSDIEIRGESRQGTIVENLWQRGVGYEEDLRPLAFSLGNFHPQALDGSASGLDRYNVVSAVEAGSSRVKLANPGLADNFPPGTFAMLASRQKSSMGGISHPDFAQINRVLRFDGDFVEFERPFKRRYDDGVSPRADLYRFDTGQDVSSGFGPRPWTIRADVTLRNLSTRGGDLLQRTGAWNLLVEDVDHRGRNGIVHNAFVHSTLRRLTIVTGLRGIETKGESFDVLFEDVSVAFESALRRGPDPLVANGERSEDIVYRRVNIVDGRHFGQGPSHTTAQIARMRLAAYDTVLEDVSISCSEPGSQALQITTERGGERTRSERLRLVSVGTALTTFARITASPNQIPPLFEARGVALGGKVSASTNQFWVEKAQSGSYMEDFSATEADYAPVGGGLSSAALLRSLRFVSRADVRNADRAPNTTGKALGDRFALETGAPIFASGSTPFDPWSYTPPVDGVVSAVTIAIQPGRSLRDKDSIAFYKWNAGGGGTYYVSANPSGNPNINGGAQPNEVYVGDATRLDPKATIAALTLGSWTWADPGTPVPLGYNTVVLRLPANDAFPAVNPDNSAYRDAIVRFIP